MIVARRWWAGAAVALALTACAAPSGAGQIGPPPVTTTAPPTTTPPTTAAGQGPDEASACVLDDLDAVLGAVEGDAGQQQRVAVVWTNSSDEPCTMTGFGGVDLAGPDDATFGPTYSLPRTAATPERVELEPGGRAESTITFLPPSRPEDEWTPTTVRATPPDETRSAELPWPGGAVLRQDGATRPGSYLDPVRPG